MSRTVSSRIPKELHEELRKRCNGIGCSLNDYILESIKLGLYGSSDFDFDWDDEINEPKNEVLNPTVISIK